MKSCDYWWDAGDGERCDLTDGPCECGGDLRDCSLNGKAVDAALREEEKITLAETALRARRARKQQEAS